ncbi:hypothetical protein ACFL4K_00815 [Candidatus Neomarinimicrobiota bacterium]
MKVILQSVYAGPWGAGRPGDSLELPPGPAKALIATGNATPGEPGAVEWLREILASGPRATTEILEKGAGAGFSTRTLERAKRQAGIAASRVGEIGVRGGGLWVWTLNDD